MRKFFNCNLILILFFSVTALADPTCAIDRGNPARTGEYATTALKKVTGVLWKTHIGGETPLVCYNNLVIAGGPTAIQIDNGQMIWRHPFQLWGSGSTVHQDTVYATADFGRFPASLLGIDAKSGKIISESNGQAGVRTSTFTPIILDNIIYYNSGFNVIAYDSQNKKNLWEYQADNDTSPLTTDGKYIYFTNWLEKVYALDKRTGKVIWSTPKISIGNNYLTYYKNKIYAYGEKLYVLDAATGNILWTVDIKNPYADAVTISNDKMYSRDAEGTLYAMDANNGHIIWKKNYQIVSESVVAENLLYVLTQADLLAIDKDTGTIAWKFPLPNPIKMEIVHPTEPYIMPYNGKVFVADLQKNVIAFH